MPKKPKLNAEPMEKSGEFISVSSNETPSVSAEQPCSGDSIDTENIINEMNLLSALTSNAGSYQMFASAALLPNSRPLVLRNLQLERVIFATVLFFFSSIVPVLV